MIVAPPAPPPVALAVSPSRLVLAAGETRTIEVTNRGAGAASVDAVPSGLALGLRGRPRILLRAPAVVVRPRRLTVPAGGTAAIAVSAAGSSRPGDRPALVLLATRGRSRGVAVGLRIGVLVLVRGAGPVVRRLVPLGVHRSHGKLELWLRNEGNVAERLGPGSVRVRLLRRGRVVARPRVEARELLPHARGVCRLQLGRRLRGPFVAVVRVLSTTRRFRVRFGGAA